MKILVVEDTDDSRVMLVDLVGTQGYGVESATNGVEALEKIRIAPPDIIISDILMPEMDGFELCRTVKKDPQFKKIPFLFYTATYTDPSDQKLALSMGATRFIIKPEDPAKLLKIIAEVIAEYKKYDFENLNEQPMENGVFIKQHMDAVSKKLSKKLIELEEQKEKLEKSEKKYRTMMESITDAVYICSADRKITYLNPAMKKRLGRDATGEICYKALHGLDDQCEWCVFDVLKPEGSIVSEIFSPLDNRTYRMNSMPIYQDDNSVSKMAIFQDITDYLEAVNEIKKSQKLLAQAQKLESLGSLAGGIAHDFNNILTPIIGMSELLVEEFKPDSERYEDVLEILNAGNRGKDLVKQILAFSRQSEQQKSPVRIQKVLKEVVKLCRSTIPSNIELISDIHMDCGSVFGDSTQFHQIAMNLITNAYHAVEQTNGKISIQLKETELHPHEVFVQNLDPGKYVLFSVSDNGCGIKPSHLDQIFEPYFSTKEKGKGTGLGLAVVYGLIKNHGGEIKVYSEIDQGTTFNIFLPVMDKPSKDLAPDASKELPTGTERILLVDDEDSIVRLEKLILKRLGYKVTSHASSIEALNMFQSNPEEFDLVITDMTMPNMTGDVLAKKLNEIRSDIPVIICTGFSEKMNQGKAVSIGIKGFLMKPVVRSEMAKTVRKVLDETKG